MNKANQSCEVCFKFFSKQKRPTPCGTCPKPTLMVENVVAWEIFEDTTQQLRIGAMGGVFGFDFAALPVLFDLHSVPEEARFITLKKLNAIYAVALKHWNKSDKKS